MEIGRARSLELGICEVEGRETDCTSLDAGEELGLGKETGMRSGRR